MKTQNIRTIRKNKKIKHPHSETHFQMDVEKLASRINYIGIGGSIRHLVVTRHSGNTKKIKMYSGLIVKKIVRPQSTIYLLAEGRSNGGLIKIRVGPKDDFEYDIRRQLIELRQENQFIPVDKDDKFTFDINKIFRIKKIDLQEWEELVKKLIPKTLGG